MKTFIDLWHIKDIRVMGIDIYDNLYCYNAVLVAPLYKHTRIKLQIKITVRKIIVCYFRESIDISRNPRLFVVQSPKKATNIRCQIL